jgi:hypothetical protein
VVRRRSSVREPHLRRPKSSLVFASHSGSLESLAYPPLPLESRASWSVAASSSSRGKLMFSNRRSFIKNLKIQ